MKIKKQIEEISLYSGTLERTVENDIIEFLNEKLSNRQILNKLRKFASKLFIDLSSVDDYELSDYWKKVEISGYVPKKYIKEKKLIILTKNFFWSSFIYYLAKNTMGLKKYDDLEYLKKNDIYFFFDSVLEDYVGFIKCNKLKDIISLKIPIKKSALVVYVSAIHPTFKGKGYGKKMYLAVIEDAGCLISDQGLYSESLNIWVNVLPKNVNYVGFIDDEGNLRKIKGPIGNYSNIIKRFFATNDLSFLKSEII
jgi:hypothetical protein